MFSLCQTGGRLPTTGEYHDYPFPETLHYANAAIFRLAPGQEYLESFDKEALKLMTPIKRERENSGRCNLKGGETYVLIPSAEIQGKKGVFYLSAYFNKRLRDVEIKRVFHPMDNNSRRDEVLPYLIPEEAEKLVNQTPLWKIALVRESLMYMMSDEDQGFAREAY